MWLKQWDVIWEQSSLSYVQMRSSWIKTKFKKYLLISFLYRFTIGGIKSLIACIHNSKYNKVWLVCSQLFLPIFSSRMCCMLHIRMWEDNAVSNIKALWIPFVPVNIGLANLCVFCIIADKAR